MDRFSKATWNDDSVKCRQGDITGSLAATENSHVSEERILYMDLSEDDKCSKIEQQPPGLNGKVNNLEKISNIVRNRQNCDPTTNDKLSVNSAWNSDVTCKRSSVSEVPEVLIVDKTETKIEMDEGVGCEVESDNNDEDDDIDEDYNLVMNMEVSDDLKVTEDSSAATPFVPVSMTTASESVASLARASSLVLAGAATEATDQAPAAAVTAISADNVGAQVVGAELQSTKHPTASQMRMENTVAKVAAGAGTAPNPRSLPIHCVIEQTTPETAGVPPNGCQHSRIVLDTYAILPGTTLFSELVKTSLMRLGYSPGETAGAKGGIQLKNWKTLMFEAVTDNREATVEEILGELTSVATLKIQLTSQVNNSANNDDVKDRLLQLLLTKSIDFLVQAGCPIEKSFLEAISLGEISQSISEQVCTSFNDWYKRQKINTSLQVEDCQSYSAPLKPEKPPCEPSLQAPVTAKSPLPLNEQAVSPVTAKSVNKDVKMHSVPALVIASSLPRSSPLNLDVKKEPGESDSSSKLSTDSQKLQHQNHSFHGQEETDSSSRSKKSFDKNIDKNCLQPDLYKFSRLPNEGNLPSTLQSHPSNPYLGLMPGKTRIRTSFDPEHEIPRLQKWFSANQHPTREQMMRFMHELNGLESRKGRRPLDLTNIIYWFKNARAAQRRATRALDDSFENEENIEMNSVESGSPATETVPPFLPNKNAVYMIPFHPYPHLMPSVGDNVGERENITSGTDVDEPYDLSLTKRPSSEISRINCETEKADNHFLSLSTTPSPTKSSSASSECENQSNSLRKKRPYCPPRFPALLDVASKMRQEMPHRSEDIYFSNSNGNHTSNQNDLRVSLYRSRPESIDMEHSIKNEDIDSNFSDPPTPYQNGEIVVDKFTAGLKMKHEDIEYFHHHNSRKNYRQMSHMPRDSGLELGQVKKENEIKVNSSDEDNESSNDSYNSEEEFKLRIKQNAAAAAVVDYASAMHSNVSRLTAANMAALSLAQMGQPLHIPQLTSSLAMAYYPMDPRFYSQPAVPHSLSASPPTSLAATHTSHLTHLSLRQSQDCTQIDSRSPLSSPSLMQQSLSQLNHHHQQQQSPQHPHHRHSSEPRKRRTRVFIDPLTEIPKLEKWFTEDTHPSAFMIDKYCEELNKCEYRHKFPKLEPKNVQLWFKNHRAKVKRMKVTCDDHVDHNGTGEHDDDIDD